ncbi:GNAT family N-acetyltransferase [Sphingomonas olei]|uniref:GNAT family N-acetyltransferase n=1 Tax=Sphingomonas olei TaxID=1886787 RepID=A0ABY2QIF5_9SPHN|nr:GNAT family N-acetyltransferase [Sphingomonas olei]THG40424.1 GNAT family N-acetyltransferase [Sphingomonas olei]
MSVPRYLIDTNVFIGLEDHAEVAPVFSSLLQLAASHGVEISVHEAAIDDIGRDSDLSRREVSLSKIRKFPTIEKVLGRTKADLEVKFGPIKRPNDLVDATLLDALDIGVADFLVTQDQGLHARAMRFSATLGDRVLYVADAVSLLRTTYEPIKIDLPSIREVQAHMIPQEDEIFETLRGDYGGFDKWWREKCVKPKRPCWIAMDGDEIAGLLVRKDETRSEATVKLPGEKILKVCTFKVRPESRGIKLGELLLKQALWHAQSNSHDIVYLTTFQKQAILIGLLEYYGFEHTHSLSNGEMVYEKPLSRKRLKQVPGRSLFETARKNYPRFCTGPDVASYVVPIKQEYHEVLFPELVDRRQLALFDDNSARRPGNTIRKVYLCRAQAKLAEPGALLFFYKGKSSSQPSQVITTVGIFEEVTLARSTEELRRMAGGRSVYSDAQLIKMQATAANPVKVINFLLAAHFDPPISLATLQSSNVFAAHPPQSIKKLTPDQQRRLLGEGKLGFMI